MKRKTFITSLAASIFAVGPALAYNQNTKDKKMLIVYYSWSGNTRRIVEFIKKHTNADVLELVPETSYPSSYNRTVDIAKKEVDAKFQRPLKNAKADLSAYDTVFVGSPNWWGTISSPVRTFLMQNNLSGKTVALFMTHEGSRTGRAEGDLREICPSSKFDEALAVRGGSAGSAEKTVQKWLSSIGAI